MAAVALVPRERSRTRMAGAGAERTLSTDTGSGHKSVNSKPRAVACFWGNLNVGAGGGTRTPTTCVTGT